MRKGSFEFKYRVDQKELRSFLRDIHSKVAKISEFVFTKERIRGLGKIAMKTQENKFYQRKGYQNPKWEALRPRTITGKIRSGVKSSWVRRPMLRTGQLMASYRMRFETSTRTKVKGRWTHFVFGPREGRNMMLVRSHTAGTYGRYGGGTARHITLTDYEFSRFALLPWVEDILKHPPTSTGKTRDLLRKIFAELLPRVRERIRVGFKTERTESKSERQKEREQESDKAESEKKEKKPSRKALKNVREDRIEKFKDVDTELDDIEDYQRRSRDEDD